MAGMENEEEDVPEGKSFNDKTVLQRMGVIFAGPLMNFILAISLFVIVFAFVGVGVPTNNAVVGQVLPDRPAAEAGLTAGDKIKSINGQQVENWKELTDIIHGQADNLINLTVIRQGEQMEFKVTPEYDQQSQVGLIGIYQEVNVKRYGVFKSVWLGLQQSYEVTKLILVGLAQMITGQTEAEVTGPVGIVSLIGQAVQFGLASVLNFAAILSLHLGLINLFPIPALDGSRLVFLGFEGMRGRPLDPNKENFIHLMGFVLLMLLMVVITYKDIAKLFG